MIRVCVCVCVCVCVYLTVLDGDRTAVYNGDLFLYPCPLNVSFFLPENISHLFYPLTVNSDTKFFTNLGLEQLPGPCMQPSADFTYKTLILSNMCRTMMQF